MKRRNDFLVGAVFDKAARRWEVLGRDEQPVLKAVWEAMKPYMKQKRIPYSDSWVWD